MAGRRRMRNRCNRGVGNRRGGILNEIVSIVQEIEMNLRHTDSSRRLHLAVFNQSNVLLTVVATDEQGPGTR
jgi:hypothetical protein